MTQKTLEKAEKEPRKNLPKDAGRVIADARNDITIPFFSDVLQPVDDTLIQRGSGKGLKLYDEIERDTQASAVLQKRKKTLIAREWEVLPGGDDARDLEAADFVRDVLSGLPFDQICEDLLDATLKGFAVSEVVWMRDGKHIKPKRIMSHDQRRFVFDFEWKPRLLTLANMNDGEKLPDRKFMVHRYGVKGNNPYGLGLGSKLFWPVLFKREGVTYWLTFLDKFAAPSLLGKVPFGLDQDAERKLLEALASLTQNSAATVPTGTEIDILESGKSGSITYDVWLKYWDKQLSIATLGETLTTDIGDKGSKAAAETHANILELLVDADGDLLSGTLKTTLIQWLIDFNFPGAALPEVWRVRASNELEAASVKQAKAKASAEENKALMQVVRSAAHFDNDDDAREYIKAFAPNEMDEDMLERLTKARHAIGTSPDIVHNGGPSLDDEGAKKKELKAAEFADAPNDEADVLDALFDRMAEIGQADEAIKTADIFKAFDNANDFEGAARNLLELQSRWSAKKLGETLGDALNVSALHGREAVLDEMADDAAFSGANALGKPFKEQVEFFKQKEPRPTKEWTNVMRGDHDRAFVVAGAKDRAMLQDFQAAIGKAIEEGTTLQAFRDDFDAIVARYGWSYKGERGWRSKVIYETNIRTSHMAGRLKQMLDPAVMKARPFWEYVHGQTRKPKIPREQHLAWDGLILAADDDWFKTHFPPNDWGCSCGVRTLSQRDLDRRGLKVGQAPSILMEPHKDRVSGKLTEKPQGVGFGWDTQPGGFWARGLTPSQVEESRAISVVDLDVVEPLDNMIAKAKPFKAKALAKGKAADFYVSKFMSAFGAKLGEAVLFEDKAGEKIVISDELFRNAKGDYKALKRDRELHLARLAEVVKDPDEIWIGVAERLIPDDQGGGKERVLDRKYIRVDPNTGLLVIFELFQDVWSGKTAFHPLKKKSVKTDVNQINKRRAGKLIYKRGEK